MIIKHQLWLLITILNAHYQNHVPGTKPSLKQQMLQLLSNSRKTEEHFTHPRQTPNRFFFMLVSATDSENNKQYTLFDVKLTRPRGFQLIAQLLKTGIQYYKVHSLCEKKIKRNSYRESHRMFLFPKYKFLINIRAEFWLSYIIQCV